MGARMRAYDWSATPLGAPETWPYSLRMAVRIMLASRQPIWIGWGDALTYLYNDPYKTIIGGRHPWALGQPVSAVWGEVWGDIGPMLATAMGGGEGTYVEERLLILERNGYPEETYYTFSHSPIPTDDGTVGGIICANTDDTQRVIGDRQLGLLRDLAAGTADARSWQAACEASAAALATNAHDLPFAAIYAGERQADRLTLAATAGLDASHPAVPATLEIDDAALWPAGDALRGREPIVVDLDGRFEGPVPRGAWPQPPRQAIVMPITGAETGLAVMLVAGLNPYRTLDQRYRDFLDLVGGQIARAIGNAEAYERERHKAEALAEIDRAKTRFFSNISHEFRTPLTLMLGPLEEILAKPADAAPASRDLVGVAHRNGLRLMRMVNALLDLSRIETGRMQPRFVATDLAAYTSALAATFRPATAKAGLTLTIDVPPLTQGACVDRGMWETIVLNLVSNAFKFTFAGEIRVTLRETEEGFRLTVADTGTGIAEAELPRLFDRFHRVAGVRGRSFEGSGIGLALVRELAHLHGGMATVESREGEGSRFHVTIPAGSAHLPADQLADDAEPAPPSLAGAYVEEALRWLPDDPPGTADTGDAGRVIVAEDNGDMRDHVTRLLRQQGYAVETVSDGTAALDAAHRERPDLLLTDVMMPGMDGVALVRRIRADAALCDLPVLMLSARAGDETEAEGIDAGADDYLAKPFSARELIARVAANIATARVRREAVAATRDNMIYLRLLLDSTAEGFYSINCSGALTLCNAAFLRMLGFDDESEVLGRTLHDVIRHSHPDGRPHPLEDCPINRCAREGTPAHVTDDVFFRRDGTSFPVEYRVRPIEQNGVRQGAICTLIDTTERRRAERALEEETRTLATLNRTGAALAAELELDRVVQMVTDAGVELTGAAFGAFFYNVVDDRGETYTLYTLSGVERSAFERFPMPRNTAVFGPTFRGEGVVRSDDIRADPRYGHNPPYNGMPEGHLPVASHLAVSVISRTGAVIGGLFFGHPERARFSERHEHLMEGLAAQAAIAIDNARLFQSAQREIAQRRAAQEELRDLNATLEQRVAREVQQRIETEEALRQAQKMEAVGQLTGGIAHDFNNLLTVVTGNIDMASRALDAADMHDPRAGRALDNAMKGAERAAALTQRLLAFSRRQPLAPKPANVDKLLLGMSDLLYRALGETVRLEIVTTPGLWRVEVDPNQLENAILNLAVNARDALPQGGALMIETANAQLDEGYSAAQAEVAPGQYVVIAVTDTGTGMSRETMARVFEPFFTTKEVGKGTGLGLSMVYGFVKQSGGHVKIYSEEGEGTTVKIYLPRFLSGGRTDEETSVLPDIELGHHQETILVVEDDDDVRAYTVEILRELGYRVLEAHDGPSALSLFERQDAPLDLLFTDVVMPGMTGSELAALVRERQPDLRILFTSGYTRNAIVHGGRLDSGVEMIAKPFSYAGLAQKIRDVLDTGRTKRVLVVEPDRKMLAIADRALHKAGYIIEHAANAGEALGKIRAAQGRYDIVMLDANLPDRTGGSLAAELRALHVTLPLLIMCKGDEAELARQFAGDPCVATIAKPVQRVALVTTLRALGIRCAAED